jgi:hypothetical protein
MTYTNHVNTDEKGLSGLTIGSASSNVEPAEPSSPSWRLKKKPTVRDLGLVRITLDLSDAQHRNLRIAALDQRISARQLIINLLTREGI